MAHFNHVRIGGRFVQVISQVREDLFCLICSEILDSPYQSPCGCRFCYECIQLHLQTEDTICPGKTDYCIEQELDSMRDLRPDNLAIREIEKLVVRCPFQSCEELSRLRKMSEHISRCGSSSMECGQCGSTLLKSEYDHHVTTECSDGIVKTESCNHIDEVTSQIEGVRIEITCVNGVVESLNNELKILSASTETNNRRIGGEMEAMKAEGRSKDVEINRLRRNIEAICTQLQSKEVEITRLSTDMVTMKKQSLLKEIEVTRLSQAMEAMKTKSHLKEVELSKAMEAMKAQTQLKEIEVTRLSKAVEAIKTQSQLKEADIDRQRRDIANIRNEMSAMKAQNQSHFETSEEFSQQLFELIADRAQKLSVVCQWTIEDFNQVHSLEGPIFYSHMKGYKMRLMIEKKTKGYLSIYVKLLHGEYDDYLEWPFYKYVQVMIMDQDGLGRDFKKCVPFTAANEISCQRCIWSCQKRSLGFSDFIAYRDLKEEKSYLLQNNRLMIHCLVHELPK